MKEKRNIFMIVPVDIHRGVVESQMFGLAKYYSRHYKVNLVIPISLKILDQEQNLNVIYYKNYKDIKKVIKNADVIYFRSIVNFAKLFIYCKLKRTRILYDFRGIAAYENFYKNKSYPKFLLLFMAEFFAYHLSNKVQCVSENMKTALQDIFLLKRKIEVIPCLSQKSVRRTDGCLDTIKFVYVGGVSQWQMIDKIIWLSCRIQQQVKSEFTFVTNDPDLLIEKIRGAGLANCKILSGDNKFVHSVLVQQDFAFLLRENQVFNRLSSPIKFLEYVSNGVVPIVTSHVGDYSNHVEKGELGIIYNMNLEKLLLDINEIIGNMKEYRVRLYNYSRNLTWDKYTIL